MEFVTVSVDVIPKKGRVLKACRYCNRCLGIVFKEFLLSGVGELLS